MRQSNNPAIIALEMELAETKAKLRYFERLAAVRSDERPKITRDGLDLGALSGIGPRLDRITIPLRAEITAAKETDFRICVRAQTFEPKGSNSIGLQYFIDERDTYDARDQAALLGYLHENFNHQLAAFIRK